MTFEQWLEKEYPHIYAIRETHGIRDWIVFGQNAFNVHQRLLNRAAEELKDAWEGSWGDVPQDSVYHVIVKDTV